MADTVTLHAIAGSAGKWCAIRLQDGTSDNTAYDSRSEALSHQFHPEHTTYLLIPPGGMSLDEADRVLAFWRQVHDAGFRAVDPVDDFPSMPLTAQDARRQIRLFK
jgi:hypothetical protein